MIRAFALTSLILAIATPTFAAAKTNVDKLKALRGTSRPVVILSDSRDDPRVAREISALDRTRPDLDKRNIQVLLEAKKGSKLRKNLGVEKKGFAVVLVGKDGSVKKVWRDPVDPHQIFTVIDSMPMRQQEMRG